MSLCLHLAELAPRDHRKGLHDIRKLGTKSNLQDIVGQQRHDPILGGRGCASGPCRIRGSFRSPSLTTYTQHNSFTSCSFDQSLHNVPKAKSQPCITPSHTCLTTAHALHAKKGVAKLETSQGGQVKCGEGHSHENNLEK